MYQARVRLTSNAEVDVIKCLLWVVGSQVPKSQVSTTRSLMFPVFYDRQQ